MIEERRIHQPPEARQVLQVYSLGVVDLPSALAIQQRCHREVAAGGAASVLLCEHPPNITVGREGSCLHFDMAGLQLDGQPWPVRWVNRGGGCWLHLPGQLAIYAITPLQRLNLTLPAYLRALELSVVSTLAEVEITSVEIHHSRTIWANGRPIAGLGVAVDGWISQFGAILNVNPSLDYFRRVRTGSKHPPMTSLQRECRKPIRAGQVREGLVQRLGSNLGFGETVWYSEHPLLRRKVIRHAIPAAR